MNACRLLSTLVAVPLLVVAAGASAQSKADAGSSEAKKPAAATAAPSAKKAGAAAQAAPNGSKAIDSKSVTPATLRNKPAGSDAYPSDCHHSAKDSDA